MLVLNYYIMVVLFSTYLHRLPLEHNQAAKRKLCVAMCSAVPVNSHLIAALLYFLLIMYPTFLDRLILGLTL